MLTTLKGMGITRAAGCRFATPAAVQRHHTVSLLRIVVLALLLGAGGVGAASGESIAVDEDAGRMSALDVRMLDGSLTITGTNDGRFTVDGEIIGEDDGYLDVERARGGWRVAVRRRDRPGTPSAEVEIGVPESVRLFVEAGNANVDIAGVSGSVTVHSRGGAISLEHGGESAVDLSTVGGDISVSSRSLTNVRARTVDGAITVQGERARTLKLRTTGGDMDVSVERFREGEIRLYTASGTVSLSLGERSAAWIEMPRRGASVDPTPEQAEGSGFGAVEPGGGKLAYRVGAGFARVYISNTGGRNVLRID